MGVKITDSSAAVKSQMSGNIAKALTAMGLHGQRLTTEEITRLRAVDTGRLRASVAYEVDSPNKRVHIGTNVEYGTYIYEGTSRMAGRPFLTNAIVNKRSEYQDVATKILGEGFKVKTGM